MADPVFDTSIIVDWLSGKPQASVELSRYKRHRMSRISWMEILAAEPLETRDHLQSLLAPFDVIELDSRIAAAAADIHNRSRMQLLDATILATAQVNGAILVTRNTDFPANMPGVRIAYTLSTAG